MSLFWLLMPVALAIILLPYIIEARREKMDAEARRAAPGQFVTLSQGITHYQWHGPARGPVLVAIHGLTTPSFVWDYLIRHLALMGFRILTYDLYGRGYSARPRGAQNKEFFQRQLNDLLLDQLVGREVNLIGYSMGGVIATEFAASQPERVQRLILIAPAGMGVLASGLVGFMAKTPLIGDWFWSLLFPPRHRSMVQAEFVEGISEKQVEELNWRGFVPAVLSSLRGVLGRKIEAEHRAVHAAGIPVLAIWGGQDEVIPQSAIGTLAEWSRNTRHEVIEDAHHGLAYSHPTRVAGIIRAWVGEME